MQTPAEGEDAASAPAVVGHISGGKVSRPGVDQGKAEPAGASGFDSRRQVLEPLPPSVEKSRAELERLLVATLGPERAAEELERIEGRARDLAGELANDVLEAAGVGSAMRPQPHGGALKTGNPGNKGGPGRPPNRIRERAAIYTEDGLEDLNSIMRGQAGRYIEDPNTGMPVQIGPTFGERIRAFEAMAKVGKVLGPDAGELLPQQPLQVNVLVAQSAAGSLAPGIGVAVQVNTAATPTPELES